MIRRRRWAAIVATLTVLTAACGVGSQREPEVIPRDDVPFGLARPASEVPTTVGTTMPYVSTLYFLSGDRLRPVVHRTSRPPTARSILRDLARGPDNEDSDAGLRTLVPPDTAIERVTVDGGVATVSLAGPGATRIATDRQALGIAQVVYTITDVAGVARVRFEVDGRPAEVPRGDGTLTSRAVDRTDYPAVT